MNEFLSSTATAIVGGIIGALCAVAFIPGEITTLDFNYSFKTGREPHTIAFQAPFSGWITYNVTSSSTSSVNGASLNFIGYFSLEGKKEKNGCGDLNKPLDSRTDGDQQLSFSYSCGPYKVKSGESYEITTTVEDSGGDLNNTKLDIKYISRPMSFALWN